MTGTTVLLLYHNGLDVFEVTFKQVTGDGNSRRLGQGYGTRTVN